MHSSYLHRMDHLYIALYTRHFFHPNRLRRWKWVRGVRAVVDVGFTLPAAQGFLSAELLCEKGRAHDEREADGQGGVHGRLREVGLWHSRRVWPVRLLSIQRLV